jgi:hypothetical protein
MVGKTRPSKPRAGPGYVQAKHRALSTSLEPPAEMVSKTGHSCQGDVLNNLRTAAEGGLSQASPAAGSPALIRLRSAPGHSLGPIRAKAQSAVGEQIAENRRGLNDGRLRSRELPDGDARRAPGPPRRERASPGTAGCVLFIV